VAKGHATRSFTLIPDPTDTHGWRHILSDEHLTYICMRAQ
jgi:hypothetical protein